MKDLPEVEKVLGMADEADSPEKEDENLIVLPNIEENDETKEFGKKHIQDMLSDYNLIRANYLSGIATSNKVLEKLKESIEIDIESDQMKYLARKAEVYSNILRTFASLNTDIQNMHIRFKELFEINTKLENDEDKDKDKATTSEIKKNVKRNSLI